MRPNITQTILDTNPMYDIHPEALTYSSLLLKYTSSISLLFLQITEKIGETLLRKKRLDFYVLTDSERTRPAFNWLANFIA